MRAAPNAATAASRTFDLLSLGTFVVLGLPDGMLGTAWPAMRHSFGEPVGDLGLILLVNTIGSVVVAGFGLKLPVAPGQFTLVEELLVQLRLICDGETAVPVTLYGVTGFAGSGKVVVVQPV